MRPYRAGPLIRTRALRLALFALVALLPLAAACARHVAGDDAVHVLTADGDIQPMMQRYIDRGLDEAEHDHARAAVIRLDTRGGLDESMRKIIQRIESAEVPVIVYVWPQGAWAASAGTFITMSAHIAAMAPSTNIGAAHPVAAGGGDIEGTMGTKVENNAAAYARSIAELRGRNADWAEKAVRESVSASADEAVANHIVDLKADNLDDLLQQVNGRQVTLEDGRQVTLRTADVPVVYNGRTVVERLLSLISDPNIAFLLLSLGFLGILVEFLHPGIFFPGVFGAIFLLLGFFALGTLPVNWAAVALIALAFVLFGIEVYVSGFGALGAGGIISLIAGGLLLTSSSNPQFQVSRWLIVGIAVVSGAFFMMVVSALYRTRRMPAYMGQEALVGRAAVARSDLDPQGFVTLEGERWRATADDGPVRAGERVTITAVEGLKLRVRRAGKEPDNG